MFHKKTNAMKNPFEKNDHKVLIAGILIGSIAAGAAAYLFLTEPGSQVRAQLAGHLGRIRDAFIGAQSAEAANEGTPGTPAHTDKAPKPKREALKKQQVMGKPRKENENNRDQHS